MNSNITANAINPASAQSISTDGLGFALHDLPPEGSALRKLGKRLAELLDEDQWAECEQMLFEVTDEIDRMIGVFKEIEELVGCSLPTGNGSEALTGEEAIAHSVYLLAMRGRGA